MDLPFEIKSVPTDLNAELMKLFTGERKGFLHVGPKKYFLSSEYEGQAAGFYNMELKPDDTWIVTFPRSGTTLTQELLWLLKNDLDYETARNIKLMERFPFIDLSIITCEEFKQEIIRKNNLDKEGEKAFRSRFTPGYETAKTMKSPRMLKSHLPLSLLPPNLLETCKVVYVARNPKDVAVSLYYQNRLLKDIGFEEDFDHYWDLFQRDLVLWAPFWSHVEEAWQLRDHPNLLFLFYEDMNKDLESGIQKVAKFLNKSLSKAEVDKLVDHLSIESFRKNPSMSQPAYHLQGMVREGEPGFIRQGKSGSWKTEFSPELNEKADKWIEEHEQLTDLRFQF
ncbi:sulfotransferase 1C4-like [Ischnura elegans]|uniref:sulfotransferase 1C4-like n=1 Tax=Ischnura elegans TaxID=197161 RepID=UPI001ED8BF91|nr:sulfotransferase 1C4-like [Ischnura elegans]